MANYLEQAVVEASRPRSMLERALAEAARPRSPIEKAIAELAKKPTRAAQLDAMARDYAEAKRKAETMADLFQRTPIRQALIAEIALPIAD